MSAPCPTCDRADCPYIPYEAMDCDAYDAVDEAVTYAARMDCGAHAVDWRSLALAMRPVVEAAEAWRAWPSREHRNNASCTDAEWRLLRAIDAYRKSKETDRG